jgi:hypothetical protein
VRQEVKKIINHALAIFSPLAAVPTGWAIYAGVTDRPAFPMWEPAAIVGALAIITTSIAAGMLIVDILAYNQGMKNKAERESLSVSAVPALLVFGLCVVSEIVLSLLIVVIPGALSFGVLVFPLMTAAGVFALALRYGLQQREGERERIRSQKKSQKTAEASAGSRSAKKKTAQRPLSDFSCRYAGAGCDRTFPSQNAANAHAKNCGFKPTVAMPINVTEEMKK